MRGGRNIIDLTNKEFGRLTVVKRDGSTKDGRAKWLCKCSCGKEVAVSSHQLRSGETTSCGCARRGNVTHGMSKTPTYKTWKDMRKRCNNPNNTEYGSYGGRGISICKKWDSFTAFLQDMGEKPSGTSIDRIDVNGNYEPSNCRWATQEEQSNNTRRTIRVTIDGETKSLKQWSEVYGMDYKLVNSRVSVLGWSPVDALTKKVRV